MNNDDMKTKFNFNTEESTKNLDSSIKKRERDSQFMEEDTNQSKKQKNEVEFSLDLGKKQDSSNFQANQNANNFTNTNTNINNNFNIIIQPSISNFQSQNATSNYNFYNSSLNNGNQHNVYLSGTGASLPYTGASTYNLYQTISQYNKLGNASSNPYTNYYSGSNYNKNFQSFNYMNGIPQSKILDNFHQYLDSSYLMNKIQSSKYGITHKTIPNVQHFLNNNNPEAGEVPHNQNSFLKYKNNFYCFSGINQSNTSGVNMNPTTTTITNKQKYIIKDMPELTVANFIQNKNVQSKYLSSITKKEEENVGCNSNNNNDPEPKDENNLQQMEVGEIVESVDSVKKDLKEQETISLSESSNYVNTNINLSKTNNDIHNYNNNFNLNINNPHRTEESTNSINSNNIVVQTKSAPAQLNKVAMNKTINYTTIGNVITFNKSPSANSNLVTATSNQPNTFGSSIENYGTVPVQNPSPIKTQSKSGNFSESLQSYIQSAFDKCKNEGDRKNCQKALTKIISASLKKGDFNTRDWTKYPLPVLPAEIKEEMTAKILKIPVADSEIIKRENRKGRFDAEYKEKLLTMSNDKSSSAITPKCIEDITKSAKIIGTCQSLEKSYLRLTTLPDPSQVRPEHILVKSLKMLKDKWKKKESDYNYISEQFRSMRQDMTIQQIQNDFTVRVYETHGRIALESYDLDQFNQCQTCLINLYEEGLNGNKIEFMAYRIIYTTLQGIKIDMDNLLKDIYAQDKKHGLIKKNFEISHAIKVMKAINTGNYFEFFKLYKITPNMGCYLIEPFLPRLRLKALQVIAVGYYTEVSISFISDKIAYESEEKCIEFLSENKITLSKDNKKILCKDSLSAINNSHLLAMLQLKINNTS